MIQWRQVCLKRRYTLLSGKNQWQISNIYYKGFSEEEIEQLENYLHRILKNVEGVL